MKNVKLVAAATLLLLLTAFFTAIPTFSEQPPVDTSTYYVGTIGQPARLDPMRAYDTASGEIIQNVYQTLIWFGDKHPVPFSPTVNSFNMTDEYYANLTVFVPVIATALPTIVTNDTGMYWTFNIRTNVTFQSWVDHTGAVVPERLLTVDDVVYSFQRQMVYDSYNAPTWMWEQVAYGIMSFDAYDEATMASMIQDWCHAGPGPMDVSFHWRPNATDPYAQWPTVVIEQMFAQTWGSIVNKDFCIEHGCWDGLWTAGWKANYWRKPDATRSPLDRYYAGFSLYTTLGDASVPDMCGTGPYEYKHPVGGASGGWDSVNKLWRLGAFHNFWQNTWDSVNNKWVEGDHVTTIIEKGIDAWPTREVMFLDGEFDEVYVPRNEMHTYSPPLGINLVYNIKTLQNDALFFTTNVSSSSAYQSYVGYPTHLTGPLPYFFANEHMRRAFAWAINYTQLIEEAWFGEATQHGSWWVDGLLPADANDSFITLRNLDTAMMLSEMNQAIIEGYNITETGFDTMMVYNSGNEQRMIAMQLISKAFASLGPRFRVNVVALDWPVFLDQMYSFAMPGYITGWLADFADPENFARAYQHSQGSFPVSQGPPFPDDQDICDAEIDAAVLAKTDAERISLYHDLEQRYWTDCLSIALVQPLGRRWARDWVQGWYYNSLLPGLVGYDLWKSAPTTPTEPVEVGVTSVTNLTNIPTVYIFGKNGTSGPGKMMVLYGGGDEARIPYTIHVNRTDINYDVPMLAVKVALERHNLTDLADGWTFPSLQGPAFPSQGYTPTLPYTLIPACQTAFPTYVYALVAPSPDPGADIPVEWFEDGVSITLPANATWLIGALVGILPPEVGYIYDTDLTNNFANSTFSCKAVTDTGEIITPTAGAAFDYYINLQGDVNGDATVNILDAIALANIFGRSTGEPRYCPNADLDQSGSVNILDAILLANNFNKHLHFDDP